MATLNGGITSTSELIRVSGTLPPAGSYVTIDSEALRINGAARGANGRSFTRDYLAVDRGVAGTTKATHSNGATLTRYYPEAEATGGGGGVTAIVSTTDPGAIGAGNLWLRLDPSQTYPPILYVRNPTDDGWADEDGSGYVLGNGLAFYDGTDVLKSVVVVDTNSINLEILGSSTLHMAPTFIELAADAAAATFAAETTIAATGRITLDGNSAGPRLDTLTIVADVGVELKSDGDILLIDGTGVLKYNGSPVGTQAAHVADGSTVDQLRDALIASGLMAAS